MPTVKRRPTSAPTKPASRKAAPSKPITGKATTKVAPTKASPNGKSHGKAAPVTVRKRMPRDEPGVCQKGNDPVTCDSGSTYMYQKHECRGLACRREVSDYYKNLRTERAEAEKKAAIKAKRAATRAAKAGAPSPTKTRRRVPANA